MGNDMKRLRIGSLVLGVVCIYVMNFLALVLHFSDQRILAPFGLSGSLLLLLSFVLQLRK